MKRITISLLTFFTCFSAFAQITAVKEVNVPMSQGAQNGFKILVPEADEKEVIRAWEKLMKEYGAKTSKVKKSDDYMSEGAVLPSIQDEAITVYAQFSETPEGIYVNTFFKSGTSFLSTDVSAPKVKAVRTLLKEFARSTAYDAVEARLKDEEKKLERLNKEQSGLEKDKAGYEKDIKEARDLIAEREKQLEQNSKDQETKQKEISEQNQKVSKEKGALQKYK